jgi:release factor glutamine methyltransferase
MIERITGRSADEIVLRADDVVTAAERAELETMLDRRRSGEPIQYVLGRWSFRHLDLLVDRRVLIPRPETEGVAGLAIGELQSLGRATTAVDLGTGSGAIALSIADELWPRPVDVWGTDISRDALTVARANRTALGDRASRVHLVHGDWYEALPSRLAGTVDVIVSNPPYVAAHEPLPVEVSRWEPRQALVAGPTGLEAMQAVLGCATHWLRPSGAVVVEIGATQADDARQLAANAGLELVTIHADLAGRDRALVARAPGDEPVNGQRP